MSDLYSLTDVPADDETAVTARIVDIVRRFQVSVEQLDELDENGNVQIRFYGDEENIAAAVSEIS
jgi:hypothetical protein